MSSLTRDERARLEAALGVAALRLYGRRRVAEFSDQDHSRSHIARLATEESGCSSQCGAL
jgi:hypothetical protein